MGAPDPIRITATGRLARTTRAGLTRRSAAPAMTVAACLFLCGCSSFVKPEGDGGWDAARRMAELGAIEQPPPTPAGPSNGVDHPAEERPQRLDLDTVLRLVRERNPRVQQAERQRQMAEGRVGDVRGRLLPSATGSARYTWYSDPQTTSVQFPSQLLEQFQLPSAPDVTIRQAEAGVFNGTLSLPIDLSGELRHGLRAAQAGYRGERARQWATLLEQETAAIRAYLRLLEAQRLYEVSEQTLAQVRQQLRQTQSKLDQGRVTRNELLVVQVSVRDLEQRLRQRRLAIDEARWTLNQIAGRQVDDPTELVDVPGQPRVPDLPPLLTTMKEHNPAIAALLEEQQRLEESLVSLERSYLPRFAGGGAIDYTTADIVQPQRIESGFLGLTIDFGTDLRRRSQIAEMRAAVEKNRSALRGLLTELEVSLRAVHAATLERLAALRTAQTAIDQAAENLRIRQQQFEVGRIESDKVLEAEALLAAQRAAQAIALYEAYVRRAELQQLLGLPIAEVVANHEPSR